MRITATEKDMTAICDLVHELCGVYLGSSKSYLVESRLGDLVESSGCANYVELATRARSRPHQDLRREIINKMTTNETLFFRDKAPFEALQHKILPQLIDTNEKSPLRNRIRIWSAACSTGQEVYSIAMVLSEILPKLHQWDIKILGTDISDDAVRAANAGFYAGHHIERGLPPQLRDKYFSRTSTGWQVKDSLRSLVQFERANLLDSFAARGEFDVIFCRNVAIYFTKENRDKLFDRIAGALAPQGYLLVGSAEVLVDLKHRFFPEHHCRATVYRPLGATTV